MQEVLYVIKESIIFHPVRSLVDERAIVHPTAKIADNVEIGPWTIIGPYVEIGAGTKIGPHVVIKEYTKIGCNNQIYQYVSLGESPQHVGYKGEATRLEIGDNNIIREFSTLNRGTVQGGGVTRIGNHNFIMCYVHIAHDCQIGNNTIFVNNASLAGHVHVEDYTMIGVFVGVHQFCTVGAHSFVSHAAMVGKDVLPYIMVRGHDPVVSGVNIIGLKRRGFSEDTIRGLRRAYNIIFRQNLTVKEAIDELQLMLTECPAVELFIKGLQNSKRGVLR
jgi:UDP-N-acetylglucosamine acyltransferase